VYDPPGYSQLIKVTGAQSLLFLAGQVPPPKDVVKMTTYVTDIWYRMDFRTVRDEFFGPRGPASSFIEVGSLSPPDYMIELEAIAVI
jgi:2-iminobutanoate/2-iminopropanoate deaminase